MFNVEQYLKKCIDSVIDQNIETNKFEVIMVDDESPDNSLSIANKLANKHSFIKIISQKNLGLGGARNTGIKNSKGKYIVFLDADDCLLPNSLKELINVSDKNELDILEFGANLIAENGDLIKVVKESSHSKVYNGIDYYNTINYSGSACNKIYSNEFLQKNNLFFLEKIYGEDFEFNTRALYFTQKILAIDKICAAFLQSSNSITRNNDRKKKDKYLNDYKVILGSLKKFWVDDRLNISNIESVNNFFNERLTRINVNAFYMMFKNNYSYAEMLKYKNELMNNKIFYTSTSIKIRNKDLFRKIMIQNFFLFKISQLIKQLLKIN